MSFTSESISIGPFKKDGMFNGATPALFELAKNLRKNMTDAEKLLWFHIQNGIYGLKIRRQHPLGIYIADFYCHRLKLVIELDGNIHDNPEVKERDIIRENDLKAWGYRVVRFSNEDILQDVESVVEHIKEIVKQEFEKNKL